MTTTDDRIDQFRHMAAEDPDNDMAHFSLGNALLQAGKAAEAATALRRAIELNDGMSRAYQLAGQALIDSGRRDEAAKVLRKGYDVAAGKGDVMPRNAIGGLLRTLGIEPPADVARAPGKGTAPAAAGTGGAFTCRATGRPGTRMSEPPMRGGLGRYIHENISAETWKTWIGQGTKVINELRLDFSKEQDQLTYERHMCEFLGIDEATHAQLMKKVSG